VYRFCLGRLLQVCAVLCFIAGAVGAIIVTNPTVTAKSASCDVATLCRDRDDAHPHLVGHASHHGGLFATGDHGP
jgi:hypothetical protein